MAQRSVVGHGLLNIETHDHTKTHCIR